MILPYTKLFCHPVPQKNDHVPDQYHKKQG